MTRFRSRIAWTLVAALLVGALFPASAKDPPSWSEVKCARYAKAWADALARLGAQGLGRDFLDRHDAFLASGCTARAEVCAPVPRKNSRAPTS